MPTNSILRTIFITCFGCAVILIILLQFGLSKKLEGIICVLLSICCLTNFINAIFLKELYFKGVIYKGSMAIFLGYLIGLAAILLLSLSLLYLGVLPRFF